MTEGRFIVLEGPDGCGKSTQAERLVAGFAARGREFEHLVDPGGTEAGTRIRELLLGDVRLDPRAETFLFLAARAQLVEERIRPALSAGRTVLCERYVMSTVVYQGHAVGERTAEEIHQLRHLVLASAGGLLPDLTLLLDVAPATGLGRKASDAANDGPALDRFELRGTGFQERVRSGYLEESRHHAGVQVIPPGDLDTVTAAIERAMETALEV